MSGVGPCTLLSLRNTQVTDALLPKLADLDCRVIDISGTAITAGGLAKLAESTNSPARWKSQEWQVNTKQFTVAETSELLKAGLNLTYR